MTKADIIDCVCEHVGGFSKKESADSSRQSSIP